MKAIRVHWFLLFLFISTANISSGKSIEQILTEIEKTIQNTELLAYQVSFLQISPTETDSIFSISARIWAKRVPTDTIFGAHFHVAGRTEEGEFDYFYDGQNSYEIQHSKRSITIFYPHDYPNTVNNPAKARVVLLPWINIFINDTLKEDILKDNPNLSFTKSRGSDDIGIILQYPENNYGQILSREILIDQSSMALSRIHDIVNWRGVTYRTTYHISEYSRNQQRIREHLYIRDNFASYTIKEFSRETDPDDTVTDMLGKPAVNFNYVSILGDTVSLNTFQKQLVLLDFWESWCGYCMLALPKLNNLQRKYEQHLQVIGVVSENRSLIEELITQNNLIYPNIYVDKKFLGTYQVTRRPTYVLIGSDGNIAAVTYGDLDTIEQTIRYLISD